MRYHQFSTYTDLFLWTKGIMIFFAFLILSCSSPIEDVAPSDDQDQMMDDEDSEVAPGFELMSLDGSTVKLSDYDGKVIVLFFLGDKCPLCKAVAPSIEKDLNSDYAGKADYVILGLDVWDGNSSSVQSFKDVTGVTFPLLLKASGVGKEFNTSYDRLVVINKSGRIVHNGSRAATNDLATVKSKVDELLAK